MPAYKINPYFRSLKWPTKCWVGWKTLLSQWIWCDQ